MPFQGLQVCISPERDVDLGGLFVSVFGTILSPYNGSRLPGKGKGE